MTHALVSRSLSNRPALIVRQTLRAAVVQAGWIQSDTDASVDKAIRLMGEAAARGGRSAVPARMRPDILHA